VTYRNRQLLDLARDKLCMNCGGAKCPKDTVVAAHSNLQEHGRGYAHQAHDCFHAWLGIFCHQWLDHGKGMDPTGVYSDSREDKAMMFRRAMDKTLRFLWENELIGVSK
jgi:hypothetical protein